MTEPTKLDPRDYGPVHTHTGPETGMRYASCDDCEWNVHSGQHKSVDSDAHNHAHDVHGWKLPRPATRPIVYDRPAPDWLYVGAPVVVMHSRSAGWHVVRTEVAKLTQRDIVLANGLRFRHDSQTARRRGDEIYYMRSSRTYDYTYLHAPDSKTVANHHAAEAKRKISDRVFQAARGLTGGYVTRECIDAMAAAIDEWRAANPETETEQEN